MNQYSNYKPSNIDWIGDIPAHWEVKKIGYISETITGYAFKSESFSMEEGVKIVRGDNITEGRLRWGDKTRYWKEISEDLQRFVLQSGDVVIGMDGSKVGKNYALVEPEQLPLLLVQRVARIRTNDIGLTKWLYHWIGSHLFKDYVEVSKTDPAIPHITLKDICDFPVTSPPLAEQVAIATYLDVQTAQLDGLIARKRRLMALLREEKAALVNEAVTKGIRPNVPTKPSGIDWLGDVPAHWEVKKLKWGCSLLKDGTHLPPPRVEDGYPLLSVRNLTDGGEIRFRDDDTKVSEKDFLLLSQSFQIKENDILLAIVGATMGKVSVVPRMSPFVIQRSLAIFRTIDSQLLPKYLFRVFQASFFQNLLWNNTGFSAQPGIYLGALANFNIPIPPRTEQAEIVTYLDAETAKIDFTVGRIEREIELMQEYRTALISEVVTGKVKVV